MEIYEDLTRRADDDLGVPAPDVRAWFHSLGMTLKEASRYEAAAEALREFTERERRAEDTLVDRLSAGLCSLADTLTRLGRHEEAEPFAIEGLNLTPPGDERTQREGLLRAIQSTLRK